MSISIHILKPSSLRPPHKKQDNADPRTKNVKLDPHTKTDSSSTQVLKPGHFPPSHENQANSDP